MNAQPQHNYTGQGWEGGKYQEVKSLTTKDIAKLIRQELKEQFPDCKFSVTTDYFSGGSSITVALMQAPFEAFTEEGKKKNKDGYHQVNEYYIEEDSYLTEQAKKTLQKAQQVMQQYNYSDCDGMIDYFNVNYYTHLEVGKWDKPFTIKHRTGKEKVTMSTTDNKNEVTYDKYKGHPIINLPDGSKRGFSFGVRKARAILEHYEEIKKFVELYDE